MRFLFLVLFFSYNLFCFPPKNEKVFSETCLRFLKDKQYSFLASYFKKNYHLFENSKNWQYIEEIIKKITKPNIKKKIINYYIKVKKKKVNFKIYYYQGLLFYFQKENKKALKSFVKTKEVDKYFYIAKILFEKNKDKLAKKYIGSFLKRSSYSKDKKKIEYCYLMLAKIFLNEKVYNQSLTTIVKVPKNPLKIYLLIQVLKKKYPNQVRKIRNYFKKNYSETIFRKVFKI